MTCLARANGASTGVIAGSEAKRQAASSIPTQKKSNVHPLHWKGSLIDIACMKRYLSFRPVGNDPEAQGPRFRPADTPHFLPANGARGLAAGQTITIGDAGGRAITVLAQPPESPNYPLAKEKMVRLFDRGVVQCAATPSTRAFGLAMWNGVKGYSRLLPFDEVGNERAAEALRDVIVKPGKKLEAKVTGTMVDGTTVDVDSVDVKGKHKQSGESE